jgi:hypothetical protein
MDDSAIDAAERKSRTRTTFFYLQAAAFLLVTILDLPATASLPFVILWLAWAMLLLAQITGVAAHFSRGAAWRIAEDEVTRANRRMSLSIGYFAAMTSAMLLTFLVRLMPEIDARHVTMSVLTAGISAALISFAALERIALYQAKTDD